MSQATVKDLTGSTAQQGLDSLLTQLPGLVSGAATQYVGLLRRGLKLAGDVLPSGLARGSDCCTVPTQDCPPHCVAEITWEACAGEVQRAVINVRNTGQQARAFSFVAGSVGPAKAEVAPPSAQLAPGQTVAVQVAVPPSEGFQPGQTYTGEVLIRGAYEQCVKLKLHVTQPQVAHVDISQGEVPQHITELKWYRHYQCTEPCATPATRVPPVPVGVPPTVAGKIAD